MKGFIKTAAAVIMAVLCCMSGSINACAATPVQTDTIIITCKHAPEGTAFADVLFRSRENDKYLLGADEEPRGEVSFRRENDRERISLELGRDCGIAGYNEGYSSLLFGKTTSADGTALTYELKAEPQIGLAIFLTLLMMFLSIFMPCILILIIGKWIVEWRRKKKAARQPDTADMVNDESDKGKME